MVDGNTVRNCGCIGRWGGDLYLGKCWVWLEKAVGIVLLLGSSGVGAAGSDAPGADAGADAGAGANTASSVGTFS